MEHFNYSIVEVCTPEEQGARENYYLQKYLPLLNTTFSSTFSESAIYGNLTSKLATLKLKSDFQTNGKAIPVYVYDINDKCIDINYVKYDTITKASHLEKVAGGTLAIFVRCGNSTMSRDSVSAVPSIAVGSSGLGIGESSMLNLASLPKAETRSKPKSTRVTARSYSYDKIHTNQTIITTVLKLWESLVGNR